MPVDAGKPEREGFGAGSGGVAAGRCGVARPPHDGAVILRLPRKPARRPEAWRIAATIAHFMTRKAESPSLDPFRRRARSVTMAE